MKTSSLRTLAAVAITALLIGGVAYAAPSVVQQIRWDFLGGLTIGSGAIPGVAGNKISKSLGASATYDASSITATCTESSAITVTGAAVSDPCFVGVPAAAGALNVTWSCYVSAANAAKVKVCNPTAGAIDAASGTFYVRVVSNQ